MAPSEESPLPSSTLICLELIEPEKLAELQRLIGFEFRRPALLAQAMAHRSCHYRVGDKVIIQSNEKLEHLGDRVVGLAVCKFLYLKYAEKSEGFYSQVLPIVVSNRMLAEVGSSIGLEKFLVTRQTPTLAKKVMADTVEAICGALFLDGGSDAVDRFLETCLFPRIAGIVQQKERFVE
jgi:ribonuclease-3